MKKIYILILISFYACLAPAMGDEPSAKILFTQGADHYKKGEYQEAIDKYEEIVKQGHENGAIYYNLAGAYYKAGNLGKAILNYQRANIFMPRSADLEANYKFVSSLVRGRILETKGIWVFGPVKAYLDMFTPVEMTWGASLIYAVILFVLSIMVFNPRLTRLCVYVSVFLSLLIAGDSFVIFHKSESIKKGAVVIKPETEALYGPFDSATKFFKLYEGASCVILDSKDSWAKVRRDDGKVGWVRGEDVEKIMD